MRLYNNYSTPPATIQVYEGDPRFFRAPNSDDWCEQYKTPFLLIDMNLRA